MPVLIPFSIRRWADYEIAYCRGRTIFAKGSVYGLVVLGLNLPKLNGMEVLKEIRVDNKEIPVLILSAKGEVADKIAGLDEGANDYLAKPFNFAELEARVRALLRRNFKTSDTVIEAGAVKVDTAAKRVFVSGKEIILTQKEYAVIEYLFLHKGETITPTKMVEQIWESDTEDVLPHCSRTGVLR